MSDPARILGSPIADAEAHADRLVAQRAMRIGLWVWPAFTVLDAYMCFVAYPGAPFELFLAYRIAVELVFFHTYRVSRRKTADVRQIFQAVNVSYGVAALAVALMAVHLGGIRSPYMHGISIVALIRAALIPGPWRRALSTYARIGLAFPLVMGLGAAVSPVARAEWLTSDALIVFVSNYVFVIASSILGLLSGQITWRAREQLYRARRIGRYRLQAIIGKGGMGEVWLAWDLALRRNVALKLLRVGAAASPAAVKRFEREAQATSQLKGPHVVHIFDFGASDDGLYYIAMEYLAGMDLATLVETFGPLPAARAVKYMKQACVALEEAHTAGIIHRDIKPHNLFVTRVGADPDFVKLLDFGVVRLRDPEPTSEHLTRTGLLVGTPAYVAPELWTGATADERSDVYALGVTLHFLLTGSTPFDPARASRAPNAPGDPRAPQPDHDGEIPAPLRPIVRASTASRPEDRVPSARALYDSLRAVSVQGCWTNDDAEAFWRAADQVRFGQPASDLTA